MFRSKLGKLNPLEGGQVVRASSPVFAARAHTLPTGAQPSALCAPAPALYGPAFSAQVADAQQLLDWGFANRVVADDDVLETAVAMAEDMCKQTAPFGLRLTKECLQTSLDGTSFENVIKMENRNQVLASNTNDGIMGTLKMNPHNKQDVKENPDKYAFHNM